MSSQAKNYILSALIAVIVIITFDLPIETSISTILIVIILSVMIHKFKRPSTE